MKPETLDATIGSCQKWWKIAFEDEVDRGSANCPLCIRFLHCELDEERCPVYKKTNYMGCNGTHYMVWWLYQKSMGKDIWKVFDSESKRLAIKELKFLILLLPEPYLSEWENKLREKMENTETRR